MILEELFPAFIEENGEYECKVRLDREDVIGWLKTINGFANAHGGVLFLGVEDKTHKLIGFSMKELDAEKLFFYNTLNQHMPSYSLIKAVPLEYQVRESKRYILQIAVGESERKPVIVKYKGMPMIFMRRDGFTNPATEEEIRFMAISSAPAKYDEQVMDVPFSMDQFIKLGAFYQEQTGGKGLKEKDLAAIGFFDGDHRIKKGAYLFADACREENTSIVCNLFKGETRGDDMVLSTSKFKGNLIDGFHFIDDFLTLKMNHGFVKLPSGRVDVDAFPKRAVFEAIINALAHRDYYLDGTEISVDLFNNRVVISSPGSLYNARGDLKTRNLSSIISRRRNELISSVFVLCHAMEAKGTGFEKIEEEYKGQDELHQPFVFTRNNQFCIVLPDITNPAGVEISDDSIYLIGEIQNGSKYDAKILSYCFASKKSAGEIAAHLKVSDSTFLRNALLGNLVEQHYLLLIDEGKTKRYLSNKDLVKMH